MEKHLTKFDSQAEYNIFKQSEDYIEPNVSYITSTNTVIYNKYDPIYNKQEYVDLGLPSGTMWAKYNVGASESNLIGKYFAWGEVEGYDDASVRQFSWSEYKWGTENNVTKYNSSDGKYNLDLEDDAARVNMGGLWKMPTDIQIRELDDYTTKEYVSNYKNQNVSGILFESTVNHNTIFIPFGHDYMDGQKINPNNPFIRIWQNESASDNEGEGLYSDNYSGIRFIRGNDRAKCAGASVRGVLIPS